MAVWLADGRDLSELLGPLRGRSLRRPRRSNTARVTASETDDTVRRRRFEPLLPPTSEPAEHRHEPTVAVPTAVAAYEPVEVPLAPLPPGRRDGKKVPAAYTAVEGTYREVARVPLWRKALSLVSLLGILVVVGVAIAALAGATFGAIAEMVDSAVG